MSISKKVVQQLRSGERVSDEDAAAINHSPEVDVARRLILDTDIEKLLALARDQRQVLRRTAITLLRHFAARPDVSAALKKRWLDETDFEVRYAILWRLLDDPLLPSPIHREIFDFIKANWLRFTETNRRWYVEPERIIEGARDRLKDPSFPDSKAWGYLCILASSPDKKTARELITGYADSPDLFLREVADFCMSKIRQEYA
jgi:HEAT repeat protein